MTSPDFVEKKTSVRDYCGCNMIAASSTAVERENRPGTEILKTRTMFPSRNEPNCFHTRPNFFGPAHLNKTVPENPQVFFFFFFFFFLRTKTVAPTEVYSPFQQKPFDSPSGPCWNGAVGVANRQRPRICAEPVYWSVAGTCEAHPPIQSQCIENL